MTNAELIRNNLSCSVEMPAGTGKTETIAELVQLFANEGKRSLVLTHTHAGVDVLRRRMRKFGVPRDSVTIRTLDSWCFDLIGSFPELSAIEVGDEPDWSQSRNYHEAGKRAVATPAVVRMLRASYDLLVVDEYQDCQLWQHDLVRTVAESVPTCVLGDRMQGLFFFNDARPVEWETDVEPTFPPLVLSVQPWRWRSTNPELGEWLLQAREDLLAGHGLDLSDTPVRVESPSTIQSVLLGMPRHPETTVAISQFPNTAAQLAQRLGGAYTMIEELEGRHLRAFAEQVDNGTPGSIAAATVQYAVDCAFGVADRFDMTARRALLGGQPLNLSRIDADSQLAAFVLNGLLHSPDAHSIRDSLLELSRLPSFRLFRREAWFGVLDALRLCEASSELSALDAVVSIRNKLRVTGRRPESRIVGRALLVKGLEFDHAVVDQPVPNRPYNAHELYVCLTRGARSVTLITDNLSLRPSRPTRS